MSSSRAEAVVQKALEQPVGQRTAWLDRYCAGDSALRHEVDALILATASEETMLATPYEPLLTPVPLPTNPGPPDEAVGQRLGRYKLLEKIGEGGCGVVYVAEQTEPVQRRVAVKVIKLGMDTRTVVARFEAERQALAMMDHPNIARVLDAGATETGRPYFVMELVRGVRITDYCDRANLPTRDRLLLFIKVCHAIQHAHQKGIIHRDIKPSNILVTLHDGVPVPKVIDFGISKATEGRLTDNTVYTQLHQFIGTPAYMSPEQAEMSGLDIDTRSDIYSLGVLLYELLAGSTPFDAADLMAQGLDGMRRTIREREPVRPSTRLSKLPGDQLTSTARRRSEEVPRLVRQMRGDLDWIVMKCLEKDRTRRYDSATDLAADLARYLANEPVVARPPSAVYRFQKAFRRNRLVFSAGFAVVAALVVGLSASIWQAAQATKAKNEADSLRKSAIESAQRAELERERATESERVARQTAYSSDMNLAQQALAGSNLGRARALLDRQRPGPGQEDLRDWEWRYLWSQTLADPHEVFLDHTNGINRIAYSPDARVVALAEPGGELVVQDLISRRTVLRRSGVWKMAFAHRAPLFAFISDSRSASNAAVVFWDTVERREVRRIPIPSLIGRGHLAFVPDDSRLLAASDPPEVSIISGQVTEAPGLMLGAWEVSTGRPLWKRPLAEPETTFGRPFAVSPDGRRVAAGISGGRFQVLDTGNGQDLFAVQATPERVTALAFSPDGRFIVSGAAYTDSALHIWDAATGTRVGSLEGHRSWVSDLTFSPDGSRLVSSSADQTLRIWDWPQRVSRGVLRGHRDAVMGLAFLPDGRTLASHTKEGAVFLWNITQSSEHLGYRILPRRLLPDGGTVFTPDGRSLLAVESGGGVALWDVQTLREQRRLWADAAGGTVLAVAPDAGRVVRLLPDGLVQVWTVEGNREEARFSLDRRPEGGFFTENGRYLITVHDQSTHLVADVWDVRSWKRNGSIRVPRDTARWIGAMSVSNSVVELSSRDIRIFDAAHPDRAPQELKQAGDYFGLEASPDGQWLAVPYSTGQVRLWDWVSGEPVETLRGFLLGAHAVTFSPDGRRLAAGSSGQEAVKLWDPETRLEVLTLAGQGAMFKLLKFSPDGRTLLGVNADGMAHLWSAPGPREIEASEAAAPRPPGL
jgi:serine/threonine protein kinase/WD40 repeat protein